MKHKSNKSMDVRAKQLLSYSAYVVTFGGLSGGFAPRHLNRSMPSMSPAIRVMIAKV